MAHEVDNVVWQSVVRAGCNGLRGTNTLSLGVA